jgi:hypothetical protein
MTIESMTVVEDGKVHLLNFLEKALRGGQARKGTKVEGEEHADIRERDLEMEVSGASIQGVMRRRNSSSIDLVIEKSGQASYAT